MAKQGPAVKFYLCLYNILLTLGWAYVLFLTVEKKNDYPKMWKNVEFPLKIFQSAAILEIVHAIVGFVPSNVFLTFFQVFSRVFVLWGVLDVCPVSQKSFGVPMLLFAWCVTEIIRYGYYFLNIINMGSLIVWFRYTLFIILYPIGVSGELICIYSALNYVKENGIWTVNMPNKYNFFFDFHYVLIGAMLTYIPIFPQLYLHMFAQRRKIIGGVGLKKD